MKKQIELLKKYGVTNYTIQKGVIVINKYLNLNELNSVEKDFLKGVTILGNLYLSSLTSANKDFLKGTTIGKDLYLNSIKSVDKDFLKDTKIGGTLELNRLTSVNKDFLKGTTISGNLFLNSIKSVNKDFLKDTAISRHLHLNSLTSVEKDFLKGAIIGGSLHFSNLKSFDKGFLKNTTIGGILHLPSPSTVSYSSLNLRNNVKRFEVGYNEKKGYCYFDDILRVVSSVKETRGYVIYTTPFGFIAQKNDKTAHGKTVKKSIVDLEFKFISEKLKKEPILADTVFTNQYYRILTGACEQGIIDWKKSNKINKDEISADKLLPLLKKTKAYGLDIFKQMIDWD